MNQVVELAGKKCRRVLRTEKIPTHASLPHGEISAHVVCNKKYENREKEKEENAKLKGGKTKYNRKNEVKRVK